MQKFPGCALWTGSWDAFSITDCDNFQRTQTDKGVNKVTNFNLSE